MTLHRIELIVDDDDLRQDTKGAPMSHLITLIDAIQRQHHLDRESVCRALELGIEAAARKQLVRGVIVATIDRGEGAVEVLHDGHPLRPEDTLEGGFLALAGDVAHRHLCEAESAAIYSRYRPLAEAHALVAGTVLSVTPSGARVRLGDASHPNHGPEATLPAAEWIPGERLTPGQSVEAVLIAVERHRSGTETTLTLSRAKPALVTRTLERLAPAAADGWVEIVRVARAAGYRSKVALRAARLDADGKPVDALALCAGPRGETLGALSDRLAGESVELIEWTGDTHALAVAALAPAEILDVVSLPLTGRLVALLSPEQEGLARGRKGANLFLASQLVGLDIDLRTEAGYLAEVAHAEAALVEALGLSAELAAELVAAGVGEVDDLEYTDADELVSLARLTAEDAASVMAAVKRAQSGAD